MNVWSMVAIVVILLAVVVYVVAVRWDVLNDVKNAPRTEMFICAKHGAFPAKYAISAPVPTTEKPVQLCPMCMEDSEKKARELYAPKMEKK